MTSRPIISLNKKSNRTIIKLKKKNIAVKDKGKANGQTKKTGKQRSQEIKAIISIFEKKYEDLFNLKTPEKALKKNIIDDIFIDNPNLSKSIIRKAIRFYCTRKKYLKCVIENDVRYDLNNRESDAITTSEKDYSKDLIEKIKKQKNQ